MLIDLLNSSNYIMVNREAIRIFGLNTAVYCAELLNIYKKASDKNKFLDEEEKIFKIDRKYIEKQTTLTIEDQLKCDINLSKIEVIKISKEDKDVVKFDVEKFASLLASEDVKLLKTVAKKVNVTSPKGVNEAKRERLITILKESVVCKDYTLLVAIRDWIDAVMTNPTKYLSKAQVELFKNRLDEYCGTDIQKALKIVGIATVHQYVDCQWAINMYEKEQGVSTVTTTVRKTAQKRTEKTGSEEF